MTAKRIALIASALALATGVAACGDDNESGGGGQQAGAVGAQTGTPAEKAAAAGEKDAREAVDLPKRTLGFLQYTNQAEIAVRMQNAARQVAKTLGWKFIACDGQGDPRKQGACGSTLLDRGADVIVANTIPPAASKRALQTADRRNVPWVITGGDVPPDPLIDAVYAPNDAAMSEELVNWYLKQIGSEDQKMVIVNEFPGIESLKNRLEAVKSGLSAAPNVKVVGEEEIDYTNPTQDIQRDVSQQIQKNRDANIFWSITNDMPPVVQALKSRGFTGDKRPMVVGYFADKVNTNLIRNGDAEALAEWPIEGDIWAAVDQELNMIARNEDIPKTRDELVNEYSLDFIKPTLITKDNVPPEGEYPPPAEDFVSYFKAKWAKEYTGMPGA